MTKPRVSICLPNLNNRRFLPERLDSIFAQSFSDWELVVVDSHSDDGAWEYLTGRATADSRMRIFQGPREGIYAGMNQSIRLAVGEYIYIAPSDDTMAPDCIAKMVQALDTHPDCDIAHCALRFINEESEALPSTQSWWLERSVFARSSGEAIYRSHIRRAPFDGLLLLLGQTVYLSLTQLLVRRSLFDRIGLFESRWGSVGDFNWAMRACLVANTIHVPDTWGGWRLHPAQATVRAGRNSEEFSRQVSEMIEHAINGCEDHLSPIVRRSLNSHWRREAEDIRHFLVGHRSEAGSRSSRTFVLQRLLAGSRAARQYLKARIGRPDRSMDWDIQTIQRWLQVAGVEPISVLDLDRKRVLQAGL
jgi:glycosyltransferase involved in cell wall biosynthesis